MERFPLAKIMEFVSLIHKFQQVKRVAMTPPAQNRWENDVEHSYQLVMLAWYVCTTNQLTLDLDRVLKYALVHDLPEAYAGDTYAYDATDRSDKEVREQEACKSLVANFPEFPELHDLLTAYEKREDAESRFVYALDKLIDPMNNALNNWEPARQKGITLKMQNDYKRPKVAHEPLVADYYEDLVAFIKEQKFNGS